MLKQLIANNKCQKHFVWFQVSAKGGWPCLVLWKWLQGIIECLQTVESECWKNSLRKVQNTGKWSLSYRITLSIILVFIPAYHCPARFFIYLLIFTGCGKFSIISRLRGLLTNKGKDYHWAHWSATLFLKKRYYSAMCDLLLVFNDHYSHCSCWVCRTQERIWIFFLM